MNRSAIFSLYPYDSSNNVDERCRSLTMMISWMKSRQLEGATSAHLESLSFKQWWLYETSILI
jgi:hypothetical protein